MGDKIFDAQQLLIDQQRILDKHENEIKQFSTERTELENDLLSIKEQYEKKRDTLIQAEQKGKTGDVETEITDTLINELF